MPRTARLDAPGVLHHVICRGIERRAVFLDGTDRDDFVRRLSALAAEGVALHLRLGFAAEPLPPALPHAAAPSVPKHAPSAHGLCRQLQPPPHSPRPPLPEPLQVDRVPGGQLPQGARALRPPQPAAQRAGRRRGGARTLPLLRTRGPDRPADAAMAGHRPRSRPVRPPGRRGSARLPRPRRRRCAHGAAARAGRGRAGAQPGRVVGSAGGPPPRRARRLRPAHPGQWRLRLRRDTIIQSASAAEPARRRCATGT